MKRFLLSILFFVGVVSLGLGQTDFTAVQDGNWGDGATWGNSSPGTEGVDFPGPVDDAYTNGFSVTIDTPGKSVNNLFLSFDKVGGLIMDRRDFTINGSLVAWDDINGFDEIPAVDIITESSRVTTEIIFTGTGSLYWGSGLIIDFWDNIVTTGSILINSSGTLEIFDPINLGDGALNINSGALLIQTSLIGTASSGISIAIGSTLNMNGFINGGSSSSLIGSTTINGTLNLNLSSSYLNTNNFIMGSSGVLNINFNGTNQTQGWWYQGNAPSGFSISASSTINYGANANQNIFAISGYGNLNLNSSSSTTKTLVGSGSLTVNGNLEILSGAVTFTSSNANPITLQGNVSNSGNWTTSQQVNFTGTNNQVINGSNPITFGEEVRIDKSSGNVTLQLVDQTINADLRILQGTFIPLARTVTLSGNIINDGTIEATQNGTGGFIFDGTTEISGTGTTQFRNVTINNGATLSLTAGDEIDLTTNFTNNGTFTHNEGLVRFTQSGTKNISGTSKTSFFDLAVEAGTVNVIDSVDLENAMTFAGSPTVDFDGAGSGVFTLKSTQTRDASIGDATGVTLNGNLNIERAVYTLRNDGSGKGYHMVGFPINGATVGEVQTSGFAITGTFTGASTTGTQGDGYASIFSYDESVAGDFANGYTAFPGGAGSTSSEFEHGKGYFMFSYAGDAPGTINARGTVFSGTFNETLAYTANGVVPTEDEGWHLISNPYPSAINWDLVSTSNTESDAWLWNPNAGAWEALTSGANATIPQGQAFFLRSLSGGGSITINEDDKVSTFKSFYRTTEPSQIFKVGLDNGTYIDYTYIGLKEGATYDYNGLDDASRLLNNNETISTMTADGKVVKVNRIPFENDGTCGNSIFVNLEQMVNAKNYTLNFEGVQNLSSKSIQLYDHYLDQTLDLSTTNFLEFTVNSDAASKGSTRFEIIISNKSPNAVAVEAKDICPSENAIIDLQNSDDFANYLVYKGVNLITTAEGTGGKVSIEVPNDFLSTNSNDFVIKAFAMGCDTINVGNATVQVYDSLTYDNVVKGSTICREESQAFFSVGTQINASYFVLNGTDTIQSFDGNGNVYEGFINSSELEDGLNEFTIATSKDGCQSGTLSQTLQIEVQNPTLDENITFTANNSCLKTPADVSFVSQSGVEYQIYKGATLVNSVIGDGAEQTVEIPETNLSLGLNEFTIIAQQGECATYEFPEPIQIEVEENINTNLSLITENSCGDANTSIIIENAQAGKTYTLQSAGENISSLTANSEGELVFNLNANQLNQGLNELDIQIEGGLCGTVLSSNKAVFTVYEAINPDLAIQASNKCIGELVNIDISNPQQGKTYRLMDAENIIASETAASESVLSFSLPSDQFGIGNHSLTVDIMDDNCGTLTANQSIEFELYENAEIAIVENQNVCLGETVSIDLSSNVAMNNYQLFVGEELLAETSAAILELAPTETTTYSLTGTPVTGCNVNIVNFTIEVTDLATPGILVSNNVLESSVEGDSYQWYLNGEILSDEIGKILVAQESGDYTVEVSKANCIKTSDAYTFSEEVLNANKELANAVELYPNPVYDILNIDLKNISEIDIKIYTLSGRFMDQITLDSSSDKSVDMSKFSKGTYLIQLTSGKGSITKRIIKK